MNNPNYANGNGNDGQTCDATTNPNNCANSMMQYIRYRTQGLWDRSYTGWSNAPIKSSLVPSLVFDNTDDYYFPKRGNSTTVSISFAGIGGDVYHTKLYAKTGFYFDLQKWTKIDLIFRIKAQGGYLFRYNVNDFLSLNDTFYMGGVGTLRGYTSYSVTPLDE